MKILCIHQGYELYGSDRTFLACVDFLREEHPDAEIRVILPKEGALATEMRQRGYIVEARDLWVLRKSYGWLGLILRGLRLPAFVWRAWKLIGAADMAYINTGVIFDYAIAARWYHRRSMIHVHEIPGKRVRPLFRGLLSFARAPLIYNSEATRAALAIAPAVPQRVVYNGTSGPAEATPAGTEVGRLRILMIGRINAWKGQDLLVEALASLTAEQQARVTVRILGDVFEGAPFLDQLRRQVTAAGLDKRIEFKGFLANPGEDYRWADIVVVPSREPEPFGLVAIEGMSHARPVIAARHGGLTEIVADGQTGWLVAPNDAAALARAIAGALDRSPDLAAMGKAARERYLTLFTHQVFRESFQSAVGGMWSPPRRTARRGDRVDAAQ